MTGTEHEGGRERRRYDRFIIRKQVQVICGGRSYRGTLRDISIGGAAVQLHGRVELDGEITLDINDFGVYRGEVLRYLDDAMIAVEFDIDEKQSVDLAAKLVAVYYGVGGSEQRDAGEVQWHSLTP